MSKLITLFTGLSLALLSTSTEVTRANNASYAATCAEIASSVSSASKVYFPGSTQYQKDNDHWAPSSSQVSACSFEPANVEDVGTALKIIAKDQTPFAVKSGGHAAMPGFSSTPGVQIALFSFSEITYDPSSETATIGLGLVWDNVYAELQKYGRVAVGAKTTGVGIGGTVLGGGYGYISNQYGLAVDNIVAFELVMPNGTVATITNDSDEDLFFGLRGGFNNFGIVTTVTVNTFPQGDIWGGILLYTEDHWDAVNSAIANFTANITDPKAAIYTTNDYAVAVPAIMQVLFYNAPTAPAGIFDEFINIPHAGQDPKAMQYSQFISLFPANASTGLRAMFHWIPITQFTPEILAMVKNQTLTYGAEIVKEASGFLISYDLIPFLPTLYDYGTIPSAFPSLRDASQGYSFIEVYYGWTNAEYDDKVLQLGAESAAYMKQFVLDQGQDVGNALIYPNCAPPGTPLADMYGAAADRLHSIRSAVDPDNVMSLTGGWRF